MDAVEFIKARDRICKYYANCSDCPLSIHNNGTNLLCDAYVKDNPELAVDKIEMWSKEHPRKTMLQDFLEKYPNAKVNKENYPDYICPDDLGYRKLEDCTDYTCSCKDCWNRPLEE